ncbi:hypothetical protein F511_40817 [Dorcoceras hygrometricum]|uniref:Uncharacterized protein n=1 Tax=Dorcoceras hygrometricum TaxID=472368 RepID=A0A2Z6ZZ47_9LAMI|nr:hypothetical protein F511_40817 [Dorcoceras hygrometricum]
MSSFSDIVVRSAAESLDSIPLSSETRGPMLPDEAELASSGLPWYKEKVSNLRISDIPLIKKKWGISENFEVVLPGPKERAHCPPPPGFHSFYVNQLDMGLRFLIPRFITSLYPQGQPEPTRLLGSNLEVCKITSMQQWNRITHELYQQLCELVLNTCDLVHLNLELQ